MRRRLRVLVTAGALLLGAGTLPAGEPVEWTAETRDTLGGSANPVGLQNVLERSWRRGLSRSSRPLLEGAHLSFGVADSLTPAYNRLGVWAEVAPLSILDLRAGFEPVAYFGTYKSLLRFDGYDARFDDDTLKVRKGENAFGWAGRLYLAPALKARAGRVVARARVEFEWWKAKGDGAFFYEPTRDTLLEASGDAMMVGELVVLHESGSVAGRKRLLGPVYELGHVYSARRNRRQDLGLLVVVELGRALGFRDPALYVKGIYYLEHPNRRHQLDVQVAVGVSLGRAR